MLRKKSVFFIVSVILCIALSGCGSCTIPSPDVPEESSESDKSDSSGKSGKEKDDEAGASEDVPGGNTEAGTKDNKNEPGSGSEDEKQESESGENKSGETESGENSEEGSKEKSEEESGTKEEAGNESGEKFTGLWSDDYRVVTVEEFGNDVFVRYSSHGDMVQILRTVDGIKYDVIAETTEDRYFFDFGAAGKGYQYSIKDHTDTGYGNPCKPKAATPAPDYIKWYKIDIGYIRFDISPLDYDSNPDFLQFNSDGSILWNCDWGGSLEYNEPITWTTLDENGNKCVHHEFECQYFYCPPMQYMDDLDQYVGVNCDGTNFTMAKIFNYQNNDISDDAFFSYGTCLN